MTVAGQLPDVLLLDLDDTIVSFSAGKPNFWSHAYARHASEEQRAHMSAEAFVAAVNGVAGWYWADDARAHRGRLDLVRARREVAAAAFERLGLAASACSDAIADDFTHAKEEAVAPFDGAIEVLERLQALGQRMGLLTNGGSEFQRRKLARYDLERFFEVILVEGERGVGKPDPSVFEDALSSMGVSADRAWMVGDNLTADIAAAQQCGIHGVWHDAGRTGLPDNAPCQPDRIIEHIAELLPDAQ